MQFFFIQEFYLHIDKNSGEKFEDVFLVKIANKGTSLNTLYNVCAVPWGCSVPWGVFSTVGGFMSTVGIHEYRGGYLEYRGGAQYRGGYHDKCGGTS